MLTINKAIEVLQKAKRKIGGDKVLIVSLTSSGLEETDNVNVKVINDKDSQYVQLRVGGFEGIDDHLRYWD